MKRVGLAALCLTLFFTSFCSASLGYSDPTLPIIKNTPTVITFNNNTGNVNNTQYWQGLTPSSYIPAFIAPSFPTFATVYNNINANISALSATYVPYTGATGNVNLGLNNLSLNNISLSGNIQSTSSSTFSISANGQNLQLSTGGGSTNMLLKATGGTVGISTGSLGASGSMLDVKGSASFGSYGGSNQAPTNGIIVSGIVGIGNPTPIAGLEINISNDNGSLRIDNQSTGEPMFIFNASNGVFTIGDTNGAHIGARINQNYIDKDTASTNLAGASFSATFQPSGTGSSAVGGFVSNLNLQSTGTQTAANIVNNYNHVKTTSGTGTISNSIYNLKNDFEIAGGSTSYTNIFFDNSISNIYGGSGNITNLYYLSTLDSINKATWSGNVTNVYGLYLDKVTEGDVNNYAIFSKGGTTFLNGSVGIQTATPGGLLSLNQTSNAQHMIYANRFNNTAGDANGQFILLENVAGSATQFSVSTIGVMNATRLTLASGNGGSGYILDAGDNNTVQNTQGYRFRQRITTGGSLTAFSIEPQQEGGATYTTFLINATNYGAGASSLLVDARDNGTSRFVIQQSGNVGIGTSSPGSILEVNGKFNDSNFFFANATNVGIGDTNPKQSLAISTSSATPLTISGSTGARRFVFLTNTNGGATASSLIGIGQGAVAANFPSQNLILAYDNSGFTASGIENPAMGYVLTGSSANGGMSIGTLGNQSIYLIVNNTQFGIITNTSLVGIGTTAPTQTLTVSGTTNSTHFIGEGAQITNITAGDVVGSITSLSQDFTDAANSGTAETMLYNSTIKANQLTSTGDYISCSLSGSIASVASSTERLKVYYSNGSIQGTIFDTGALSIAVGSDYTVDTKIIRVNATRLEAQSYISSGLSSTASTVKIDNQNFAVTNYLNFTGTAAGLNGGSNQVFYNNSVCDYRRGA